MKPIDLSAFPSLTSVHIPEIEQQALVWSRCYSRDGLTAIIEKEKPYMYMDNFPGCRGECQFKVAAAHRALQLLGNQK